MKRKLRALILCSSFILYSGAFATSWGTTETISDPSFNTGTTLSLSLNDQRTEFGASADFGSKEKRIAAAIYSGGSWGTPSTVSNAGMNSFEPQVEINELDHAVIIWLCENAGAFEIQASFYDGVTWSPPTTLSSFSGGIRQPRLALDDSDNALAVWEEAVPGGSEIYASYFSGGNWSTAELISTATIPSKTPDVTMNNSNEAFAIWQAFDGMIDRIEVAFFNGVSWSTPSVISTNGEEAFDGRIRINSLGNAIATWIGQPPGDGNVLQTASYDSGTLIWAAPAFVSTPSVSANQYDLAFNDSGNASVAWIEFGSGQFVIVSRLLLSNTWGSITTISPTTASSQELKISMNNSDEVVVSYEVPNETYVTVYEGGAWDVPTLLSLTGVRTLAPTNTLNNSSLTFVGWTADDPITEQRTRLGTLTPQVVPGSRNSP